MLEKHECVGCPLTGAEATSRRDFLRDMALGTVGVLSLMGMPKVALAMIGANTPIMDVKPVSVNGAMRAYAVPAQDGAGIDHDADVIIVRWQGSVFAFDLSCPHQNTALRWDESANHFRCPKHKSEYEPTGTFIRGRATRGMDRYALQCTGDRIIVNTDKRFEQDKDPAGWTAAVAQIS